MWSLWISVRCAETSRSGPEREADSEPVGSGAKAAPVGRELGRKHRVDAAREVDGRAPPGRLGVEPGAGGHVRRDVGDVHVDAVAVDRERVVVILRALGIDRQGLEVAQVEAITTGGGAAPTDGILRPRVGRARLDRQGMHDRRRVVRPARAPVRAARAHGRPDTTETRSPGAASTTARCPSVSAGPGSKYGSATTTRARVDTSPTMRPAAARSTARQRPDRLRRNADVPRAPSGTIEVGDDPAAVDGTCPASRNRATVSLSAPPPASGSIAWTVPLPKLRSPTTIASSSIRSAPGGHLGGARGRPVDQNDHRELADRGAVC